MGVDQCDEVLSLLVLGDVIRAAIVHRHHATHSPCVDVAGGIGHVLQLEGSEVFLILSIKTAFFITFLVDDDP